MNAKKYKTYAEAYPHEKELFTELEKNLAEGWSWNCALGLIGISYSLGAKFSDEFPEWRVVRIKYRRKKAKFCSNRTSEELKELA